MKSEELMKFLCESLSQHTNHYVIAFLDPDSNQDLTSQSGSAFFTEGAGRYFVSLAEINMVSDIVGFDEATINVFLVGNLGGINGIAFGGLNSVAVADYTTVYDFRALAHEIGHILGLHHLLGSKGQLMVYKDIHEKKLRIAMADEFDRLKEAAQINNFIAGTSQRGRSISASRRGGRSVSPADFQVPTTAKKR